MQGTVDTRMGAWVIRYLEAACLGKRLHENVLIEKAEGLKKTE
jgi:hypothetical protein